MTSKKQSKGELYDTQGIEGIARVGDSKKQTVEDLMERTFRRIGESEEEITRTKDLMLLARVEERKKYNDAGEIRQLIKEKDQIRDDRIRAEEREKCRHEWADYYATEDTKAYMNGLEIGEEKGRREEAVKNARGTFSGSVWENAKQVEYERGRRETAKAIFDEIDKFYWGKSDQIALNKIKARFLGKEKEAKP